MDKHTGSSYDEIAAKYAEAQDKKPWNHYFERPGTLQFLPHVSGKDVLDAGCGPGFYSAYLVDQGARVTSFDLNPFFVERTRQRTGNRAKVLQADLAEPLAFCADASFDVVICILVLHYLKEWTPALLEFQRILRSDGILFFSTHHPFTDLDLSLTGDYFATELLQDEWDVGTVRYYRRPLSRICNDLRQAGFVIEQLNEPQPIKPPDTVSFASYERAMKSPMRLLVQARKRA